VLPFLNVYGPFGAAPLFGVNVHHGGEPYLQVPVYEPELLPYPWLVLFPWFASQNLWKWNGGDDYDDLARRQ
jgi:hypothetical protein